MSVDKKIPYDALPTEEAPPSYEAINTATQPTFKSQMTIAGARNSQAQELGLDGKRDWNHGFCSCLERPGLTLAACFCPCSAWATNHTKLQHLSKTGTPNESPERVGLFCAAYTLSAGVLSGIAPVALQGYSRNSTRTRYGIRGHAILDVLLGGLFTTCAIVQEAREIEDEENALRGIESPEAFYRDEEAAVATEAVNETPSQ